MSRYRKIEVRMWADEKIRRLSGFKPSGLALWMYLLTGPHTGPIPGLFRVSEAGMAEELGWGLEAFREAFEEVFAEGLIEASLESHLLWIPNAIRYNKPESPNVIRSWRTELDILPECPLKTTAINGLFSFIKSLGKPYEQAFLEIAGTMLSKPSSKASRKASAKASAKPSRKPSPNPTPNQEQEQEQEKSLSTSDDVDCPQASLSDPESGIQQSERSKKFPGCPHQEIIALWQKHLPQLTQPRVWEGARRNSLKARWIQAAKPSPFNESGYSTLQDGLSWWSSFFAYVAETQLANGFDNNGRIWRPDLEWVIKPANFQKIIDGKYEK